MTQISIEALKEKTIGEILDLIKQSESLPENNQSPMGRERKDKPIMSSSPVDAKTQTAQELLEEIEDEN